jgi:hypothetical protein
MVLRRLAGLVLFGSMATGCTNVLPVPDYVVGTPPPYRKGGDNVIVDNQEVQLDPEGYRVDQQGERLGMVDVEAKMGNEPANSMGGYYSSTLGTNLPVRVDTTMQRAGVEPGSGATGSTTLPPGTTLPPPYSPSVQGTPPPPPSR